MPRSNSALASDEEPQQHTFSLRLHARGSSRVKRGSYNSRNANGTPRPRMHEASDTRRRFRRWAINLLVAGGVCAAYIAYRYFTTSSTTALSWFFLIAVLMAAMHYLRLSRR
jgi:hypothetical protein